MKLYLAGPMRGIPQFNFPAFHEAAMKLRKQGHYVFNPAEKDVEKFGEELATGNLEGCEAKAAVEHGFDLRVALKEDLDFLCDEAEGIALLPGWHDSRGARAEFATASALGLEIIYLDPADPNEPFTERAIVAMQPKAEEAQTGMRHDDGKLRVDLIPPEWIEALAEVLTAGAKKYADRNWELGMKWSKVRGPLGRHLLKWDQGHCHDKETGCHHLAMVAWNALALMTYELREIGENDIPLVAYMPVKFTPEPRRAPGSEAQLPQSSPA